jgi:hypothetical protein
MKLMWRSPRNGPRSWPPRTTGLATDASAGRAAACMSLVTWAELALIDRETSTGVARSGGNCR